MSKKSRRRNQALLAALVGGLALANRGKGTEMSNISVDSGRGGDSSSAIARKKANTKGMEVPIYQDPIMTGGAGVKYKPKRNPYSIYTDKEPIKPFSDLMPFKKGGRVGCGIAKKGYGKALKKGKK